MRKAVYAALAGLVALLAACGGQGGGDTRKVNASVGTFNYGGSTTGTAFILWVDLPSPTSPDGFSYTVKDPAGNQVFSGSISVSFQVPIFLWRFTDGAISGGTYTVTANPPGLPSFSRQVSVNPSDVLPQPQNIQLNMSQGSLNLSWSPVPGASSYRARVWKLDQNNNPSSLVLEWYTTDTRVQATSYSFSPGNYRAYIWASNVDFTKMHLPGQAAQLDPQFKVSWQPSSAFQVTSLGTLRLLDIPAPQGEPVDVEVFGR